MCRWISRRTRCWGWSANPAAANPRLLSRCANNGKATAGIATIEGREFDLTKPNATASLRGRGMAMIFQGPMLSLNPVFTIGRQLIEVLRRRSPGSDRKTRIAQAEYALAKVKLANPKQRMNQYPHELSGGMRQRVVIAMALLSEPALLIADEPTTALDFTVEAQIMREIIGLRDRIGCAVLLITHSLGLVAEHCDRIFVLYAGERLESGAVRDVQRRPGHLYTGMLFDCEVPIVRERDPDAAQNRFTVIAAELPDRAGGRPAAFSTAAAMSPSMTARKLFVITIPSREARLMAPDACGWRRHDGSDLHP